MFNVQDSPCYKDIIKNRRFFEIMRSKYFKKVKNNIKKIERDYNGLIDINSYSNFYYFIQKTKDVMQECIFYSNEALFGYETGIVLSYSEEHKNGVLEEEKMFLFLLKEINASIIFFDKYVASEFNLLNYKSSLEKNKKDEYLNGYVDEILKKMKGNLKENIIFQQINFLNERLDTLTDLMIVINKFHKYIEESFIF